MLAICVFEVTPALFEVPLTLYLFDIRGYQFQVRSDINIVVRQYLAL